MAVRSSQSFDTLAAAAAYLLMRTSAARAWPSMRSAREIRADTTPMRCEAACVARWKVTTLRYLCTDSPPVYLPAAIVGRVWLGPDDLSPCVTVTSSPRNSEP